MATGDMHTNAVVVVIGARFHALEQGGLACDATRVIAEGKTVPIREARRVARACARCFGLDKHRRRSANGISLRELSVQTGVSERELRRLITHYNLAPDHQPGARYALDAEDLARIRSHSAVQRAMASPDAEANRRAVARLLKGGRA